jgi:tRNA A37 threonylcarbamoyladenosine synthetase subunit TsaC/SUA5/YrdC
VENSQDLKKALFLTPTDTTIGFVSQDSTKIDKAKKRLPNKYYIKVVNSLKTLKSFSRVPQKYKNMVRRAKKTTFIMPNGNSFRVVRESKHNLLLDRLKWAYSSSANLSGKEYNPDYAKEVAEIIISEPNIKNSIPSKIYRLGRDRLRVVR